MARTRINDRLGQQTIKIFDQEGYLAIAIEEYFEDLQYRGRPQNTQHAYREKLIPFLSWCNSQELKQIEQFTPEIIRKYFNNLAVDHNPGGVHGYYRVIHAFIGWWFEQYEPNFANPFNKAKMVKPKQEPLEPIPNNIVEKILATCKSNNFYDIRDKAIISVLFDSGIRANELIMLDRSDVGDRTLHIRFGKGKQVRFVHFGNSTKKALHKYLNIRFDEETCLFIGDYGERIKYMGLRKILNRREILANVKQWPAHSFRRAFAINCLLNGWDIYRLRDEMGHNTLDVLERYLKIVESMRADLSKMTSPLDNLKK